MTHQLTIQKRLLTTFTNKLGEVVSKLKAEGLEKIPVHPDVPQEDRSNDIIRLEESISAIDSVTAKVEKTLTEFASKADECVKSESQDEEDFESYYSRTVTSLSEAVDYSILLQARLRALRTEVHSSTRSIAPQAPDTAVIRGNQTPLGTADNVVTAQGSQPQPRALELPNLPIPTFSGNVWEWNNFWELFNNNIHSQSLPVMFKFNYLLTALKGEARESVGKFQVTCDNYDKAIEFLCKKYGNKEILINTLIERLDGCTLRSPYIKDQRHLLEQVQLITAQLEELGEKMDSAWIIKKVLSKFPTEMMRRVIARRQNQGGSVGSLTLKKAIQYLDEILSTEEMCMLYTARGCGNSTQGAKGSFAKGPHLKNTLNNTTKNAGASKCMFCKNMHLPFACTTYTSPQARAQYLKENRLCLLCASPSHKTTSCKRRPCFRCQGLHHTSCCFKGKSVNEPPTMPEKDEKTTIAEKTHGKPSKKLKKSRVMVHSSQMTGGDNIPESEAVIQPQVVFNAHSTDRPFLPTAETTVLDPNTRELKKVEILFDSGAEVSFIDSSLAEKLNLPVLRESKMRLHTFGSEMAHETLSKLVRLEIWDRDGKPHLLELYTHDILTKDFSPPIIPDDDMRTIRSLNLSICDHGNKRLIKPSILLGCDHLWSLVSTDKTPVSLPSGLTLLPTKLGYVVAGKTKPIPKVLQVSIESNEEQQWERYWGFQASINTVTFDSSVVSQDEKDQWERYWAMDAAGTEEFLGPRKEEQDAIDRKVWDKFNDSIELRQDGYYVRLPWKDQYPALPDNRALAYRRLVNVWSSLKKDPALLDQYNEVFMDQLNKNIVEIVNSNDPVVGSQVHYIPHQPVLTPQKTTTKLRIVFDASAHYKGSPSLNDVLHRGPVILPPLYGLLLRFRIGRIALISDVEKAFLQVRLHEADRDATRCFWLHDHKKPPSHENVRTFRFTRVTFGLKSSPFLLAGTTHHHLSQCGEEAVAQEIKSNLYVDNLILTMDSEDEAIRYYRKSKQIFKDLSMNLREFASNQFTVMSSIPECDRAKDVCHKVLGITWRIEPDELTVACFFPELEVVTKRTVTSSIAAIYDPLGWLVPLLHRSRSFLQSLWKDQLSWDTPLPVKRVEEWKEIQRATSGFQKHLPRMVTPKTCHVSLVTFADASFSGMTACAYVYRILLKSSTLLMAKSKLPSLHGQSTIPKLELNALTLAMRLSNSIVSQLESVLNIEGVYVFTDSEIVLGWLKSKPGKELGTFVKNRLVEIRRITDHLLDRQYYVRFGYVASESNPADCGTRGVTKEEFANHYWWSGPEFLNKGRESWSGLEAIFDAPVDKDGEEINTVSSHEEMIYNTCRPTQQEGGRANKELITKGHARTFSQAKRILAYALRFIRHLAAKLNSKRNKKLVLGVTEAVNSSLDSAFLEAEEIKAAATLLIKNHQATNVNGQILNSLQYLNISKDPKGVLRCRGRLGRAQLTVQAKYPILIMQKTPLAEMIITEAHEKGHPGINHTVAIIREEFWIPQLRSQVMRIVRRCVRCQKLNNLPYQYPTQEDLPAERVVRSHPFEHVGLDYFGPLSMSLPGKETRKCYGTIITCMVTRLLHLDVVSDLSTVAFLNMLKRFFARRGVPKSITSDNAPTFLLGESILRDSVLVARQDPTIAKELSSRAIEWKHITPYAPWQGGFYERLIKSIKHSIYKTLGESVVSLDDLTTIIVEIEGMLNTRPLTYVTNDIDSSQILRPIDFIQKDLDIRYPNIEMEEDHNDPSFVPASELATLQTKQQAVAALKTSCQYTEKFWKLWQTQYLTSLREKHTLLINKRKGCSQEPREGTVVLIMEAVLPRHSWKTGMIDKLVVNSNGTVREAIVRLPSRRMIRRPINLLIPLELGEETPKTASNGDESEMRGNEGTDLAEKEESTSARYNLRERRRVNYKERNSEEEQRATSSNNFSISLAQLLTIALLCGICTAEERLNIKSPSSTRTIQCWQGGVQLISPDRTPFEVCAGSHCVVFNNPEVFENVTFPPEVILHDHLVQWKIAHANSVETFETYCPAAPFCQSIDCTLCGANIFNPECWPIRAIGAVAVISYFLITGCYVFLYVPLVLGRPLRVLANITWKLIRWLLRQLNKRAVRPRRQARTLAEILAIGTLVLSTLGCQKVDVFNQSTTVCFSGSNKSCTIQHSEVFKINPFKREACLRLSVNETTIHEIRLRWISLALYCEPSTDFFTRDVVHRIVDSKRCPHSGSCTGDKCAAINSSAIIPELDRGNHFPGRTACVESCGGPGCDCFYLSSGCLFYRIYLEPINTQVYEIFRCTRWKEEAKLEITHYDSINKKSSTRITRLLPDIPVRWKGFTFTLTSLTLPPLPLLNSQFLTDFTRTSIWKSSLNPPLHCDNAEDAQSLNCTVIDNCQCLPAETKVNCRCEDVPIGYWINSIRNQLPAVYTALSFQKHAESRVQAKVSSMVTSEIIASFHDNFVPRVLVDDAVCTVEASELTGCYSCEKGAISKVKCTSSRDNIQAEIACDQTGATIPCNTTGVISILRFSFSHAKASTRCTVTCGNSRSSFRVTGILKFTASAQGIVEQWLTGNSGSTSEIQWPDFLHIGSVFWQWYKTLLATIIFTIILLLVTYLFLSTCGVHIAIWILMLPLRLLKRVLKYAQVGGRALLSKSKRSAHSKQY